MATSLRALCVMVCILHAECVAKDKKQASAPILFADCNSGNFHATGSNGCTGISGVSCDAVGGCTGTLSGKSYQFNCNRNKECVTHSWGGSLVRKYMSTQEEARSVKWSNGCTWICENESPTFNAKTILADKATPAATAHAGACDQPNGSMMHDLCVVGQKIKALPYIQNSFRDGNQTSPEAIKMTDVFTSSVFTNISDKCQYLSNYSLMSDLDQGAWQCGDGSASYATQYTPHNDLLRQLSEFTGLDSVNLTGTTRSGSPGGPNINAGLQENKWCGMPVPGAAECNSESWSTASKTYWQECVMPIAGFFNALRCNDDTMYAVIGLAAFGQSVCYPVHVHTNHEVYWHVSGDGTFSKWDPLNRRQFTELDESSNVNNEPAQNENHVSVVGAQAVHPAGLPHEMFVKTQETGMLDVYFWAMDSAQFSAGGNHYQYAHQYELDSCLTNVPNHYTEYKGVKGHKVPVRVENSCAADADSVNCIGLSGPHLENCTRAHHSDPKIENEQRKGIREEFRKNKKHTTGETKMRP